MSLWGYPRNPVIAGAVCERCGHVGTPKDPVVWIGPRLSAGESLPAYHACQYPLACHERESIALVRRDNTC